MSVDIPLLQRALEGSLLALAWPLWVETPREWDRRIDLPGRTESLEGIQKGDPGILAWYDRRAEANPEGIHEKAWLESRKALRMLQEPEPPPPPQPTDPTEQAGQYLDQLRNRFRTAGRSRLWSFDWTERGGYAHAEVAELVEAVRGKRGRVPDEAGDVLITTLFGLVPESIPLVECLRAAETTIQAISKGTHGVDGHRVEPNPEETPRLTALLDEMQKEGILQIQNTEQRREVISRIAGVLDLIHSFPPPPPETGPEHLS